MEAVAFGYRNEPYIWIDPRSKVVLFITANITMWGGVKLLPELVLFIFLLGIVINGKQYRLATNMGVSYLVFLILDIFVAPLLSGLIGVIFLTITRMVRSYYSIILSFMFLIRTTKVGEFVAAFNKLHIGDTFIIPFSVMFRFFPTIREEWNNITNAMKFRGITFNAKSIITKPLQTMEYIIVPLLMSAAKIANELSAASLSRGLGGSCKRTCIQKICFGVVDYGILLFSIAHIVFTYRMKGLL